nr:hypothetical protein [Maridesulfovibrio hydrothermalis]
MKNVNTTLHYASRNEAIHFDACVDQLNKHSGFGHIAPYLCGVCVSSCPWGRKTKKAIPAN